MVFDPTVFTTLISTADLALHRALPSFRIVDCRFKLEDVTWGEREHASGHIPGAAYAHLDRDLSGPQTGTNGRHPLPDPATLARTFGRLGVADGVQVIAYDQDNGMFASRLWWLLRWLGHDAVAVLDGGFKKWMAEERPASAGTEEGRTGEFRGQPRAEMAVGPDDVAVRIGRDDWRLVDARAPARYGGETEPLDKVAGHIPTAVNHFFQRSLDGHGTFRTREDLSRQFREAIGQVAPDHVICYCGSGVTACHNLLALEHAGLSGAKLYPGSWSEWSSDPSRPTEKSE